MVWRMLLEHLRQEHEQINYHARIGNRLKDARLMKILLDFMLKKDIIRNVVSVC